MTVDDEDIIERLEMIDHPAYFTAEVAEMFGYTTEGMRGRLDDLVKDGRLHKKRHGSKSQMWWLPKYDEVNGYPRNADNRPL